MITWVGDRSTRRGPFRRGKPGFRTGVPSHDRQPFPGLPLHRLLTLPPSQQWRFNRHCSPIVRTTVPIPVCRLQHSQPAPVPHRGQVADSVAVFIGCPAHAGCSILPFSHAGSNGPWRNWRGNRQLLNSTPLGRAAGRGKFSCRDVLLLSSRRNVVVCLPRKQMTLGELRPCGGYSGYPAFPCGQTPHNHSSQIKQQHC